MRLHSDTLTFAEFAFFTPKRCRLSWHVTDMMACLIALHWNGTIRAHELNRADALSQGTEPLAIAIPQTPRLLTIRPEAIRRADLGGAIRTRKAFSAYALPIQAESVARACIWAGRQGHLKSLCAAVGEGPSIVTDALTWGAGCNKGACAMATAIVGALRFATCWSLPSCLAGTDIILAHTMFPTVYWAHRVITCIWLVAFDAPTCRAEAIAIDTHPMSVAVRSSFSLIESRAMLQLTMLAMKETFTIALPQRHVPLSIGRVAVTLQINDLFLCPLCCSSCRICLACNISQCGGATITFAFTFAAVSATASLLTFAFAFTLARRHAAHTSPRGAITFCAWGTSPALFGRLVTNVPSPASIAITRPFLTRTMTATLRVRALHRNLALCAHPSFIADASVWNRAISMSTTANWDGTINPCPACKTEACTIRAVSLSAAEIWAEVLTCFPCVPCETGAGAIRVAFAVLAAFHGAFRRPVVFRTSDCCSEINTLHFLRCKRGSVTCCSRDCNTTIQAFESDVALTLAIVANTIARAIIEAPM